MPTALTIVFVGCTIFLSHYFATLFLRTKIPDVLWLFTLGLLIGPVFGWVKPENFGAVGPVFTTITLIFILFESGIDQRLEPLINSLSGTAKITTYNFVGSCLVAAIIAYFNTDLGVLRSLMLGSIVGGTSSAVVTTLARRFPMSERSSTILILESAFSDVYTLAIPLTLLTAYKVGRVDVAYMTGQMIAAFLLAAMLGIVGAFGWSILLNQMRTLQNTVFTTPAFVFVIYGIVEILGYSGPIAALAFGITLGNIDVLGPPIMKNVISRKPISLNDHERAFFSEAVFLLRTFFFCVHRHLRTLAGLVAFYARGNHHRSAVPDPDTDRLYFGTPRYRVQGCRLYGRHDPKGAWRRSIGLPSGTAGCTRRRSHSVCRFFDYSVHHIIYNGIDVSGGQNEGFNRLRLDIQSGRPWEN